MKSGPPVAAIGVSALLLGARFATGPITALKSRAAHAPGTQFDDALALAGGGTVAALGLCHLVARSPRRALSRTMTLSAVVLAASQSAGLLLQAVPCFSPG